MSVLPKVVDSLDHVTGSDYIYGEYVQPGSAPGLHDITILGDAYPDVPALKNSGLEPSAGPTTQSLNGNWVNINSDVLEGFSGGLTIADNIEDIYSNIRIVLTGDLDTADEEVMIRINGDTGSNYRWGLITEAIDGAMLTENAVSTAFHIARWATISTNIAVIDFRVHRPVSGGTTGFNPNYVAFGGRMSDSSASHKHSRSWGDYVGELGQNHIQSIQAVPLSPAQFGNVGLHWIVSGQLREDIEESESPGGDFAGSQLLCVKTKLVPLTIVGILSGTTV